MAKEDKPLRLHELREKLIKIFGSSAKMANHIVWKGFERVLFLESRRFQSILDHIISMIIDFERVYVRH